MVNLSQNMNDFMLHVAKDIQLPDSMYSENCNKACKCSTTSCLDIQQWDATVLFFVWALHKLHASDLRNSYGFLLKTRAKSFNAFVLFR